MVEISYEIITAALIVAFLFLLSAEYIWLYLLSKKNEEYICKKNEIAEHIAGMFSAVIYSPTVSASEAEIDAIQKYITNDYDKKDAACTWLINAFKRPIGIPESRTMALNRIYEMLNPIEFYGETLKSGTKYEKCYAMQMLADYSAENMLDEIKKNLDSRNISLVYNAAMACAEIGDEEGVVSFVLKCEKNYNYSHRILSKCLQAYVGDHEHIVRVIFEKCNNYVKATTLKAYADEKIENLADIFIENISNSDANLKIAATKALSQLGNPEYEQKLIIALNDKNWIVRLAAVKGLENIGTLTSLEALVKATQDEEWWVRDACAKSIVKLDFDLVYVEKVLSGYDKYAADAVKNALYKQIKMNGGVFR